MLQVDPQIWNLYQILDLIGVLLNAMIGGTIARQRNFDFVGFFFLALFSGLGGGMVRDMLMQRGTAAAIQNPNYLLLALAGAAIALLINLRGKQWELLKVHADAVVLGVWAVTGSVKALAYSMPPASAIFLGVLTAVGGGMIRDIASGQVPSIFGGNHLYAVPAVLGAASMVVFHHFELNAIGMIVSSALASAMAILAYWKGWRLYQDAEWTILKREYIPNKVRIRRASVPQSRKEVGEQKEPQKERTQ
ncbi:trimeric intracellular cation channel family protein [Corynebacterium sp. 153RC1]|uniref:trimeric intracellular cation channel family protein n=1 Tax=unclassified Corynebacterium TaxID=2624378 RepID=UPI00211B76C1|nr:MULTISPECIES: trimeric intracellular cation channel family protein [unclassified Corynebacterium]MCQ9371581.1 trimeric intracellular cation channel family protein [Corynebacterium sp. 35RC1]MCQ9353473.1 trimeric intracellular cation channel family protein [Corynebacterium sp. 209RC1]MCQ9355709.1 trimeric intracellular cation channel family protein [Corynebacterium sp. 1222RC1]MCQ9357881.1 trimeric intracellular cation channel family protein [Corynebacterium sp. 122RC1]MCQ9360077.1 trimeric 